MSEAKESYQIKIYKIVNTINDEFYIGSTKNELRVRLSQHRADCVRKPNRNMLYEMMNQYDKKECFRIILIKIVNVNSNAEQVQFEQKYIDELKPTLNKYNASGRKCEHDRIRSRCKDCGGSQICEHNRERSHCKDCGGSQICEHNRERSQCKDCGGASICEHDRRKSQCKDCGGSQICEHNRERSKCKECSSVFCESCNETYSKGHWNQHCKSKKHQSNVSHTHLPNRL
jgi:hypothetical protein